jgi:HK97 family phage prohead protease
MPDQIERKFIDLKALKVSDEGSGVIEGYRSVFGEIDEGGDIVVKGFFADGIPEYLESGFTAHSHDWTFKEAVGFPIEAKEDEYGFFVRSQFHSTDDAQDVRTKAKERMEAGKKVGFSFGYEVKEKKVIEAKDFKEQLPQFIKPERLAANMKKAQEFSRIRILLKGETIEDSLVTSPMQKLAAATAIKSEKKGLLAEQMAQTTPSTWEVQSAFSRVIRKVAETAKNAFVTGIDFDWKAKATLICSELGSEMTPLVLGQIQEFLDSTDDEFYLKGITGTESFESFEIAGAALTKFAQKMRSNHEIRTKEGRILSSSNRAKVQACKDSMTAVMADLDELLAMSEPKPKEKGIDMVALRTQSERMRNRILALTA